MKNLFLLCSFLMLAFSVQATTFSNDLEADEICNINFEQSVESISLEISNIDESKKTEKSFTVHSEKANRFTALFIESDKSFNEVYLCNETEKEHLDHFKIHKESETETATAIPVAQYCMTHNEVTYLTYACWTGLWDGGSCEIISSGHSTGE